MGTPRSNFWIRNLKAPRYNWSLDKILYSFTFKEATYFLCGVEQLFKELIFHYVRLCPNEPRKKFVLGSNATREIFISEVYDLKTGKFKHHLWKINAILDKHHERFRKGFYITLKNQEKLMNLMNQRNINQRKNLCVII